MKKKPVSKKQRSDIKRALDSLPSLLVEHVAFSDEEDMNHEDRQKESARKKYIPSDHARKAHQKKQRTVGLGVGVILLSLLGLWLINAKSFFFDAKHSTSSEEILINSVKRDFDATIGTLSERQRAAESAALAASSTTSTPETTTSTTTSTEMDNTEMEYLKAALGSLLSSSTASSSAESSTTTPTSTTSTTTESTETEVPTTSNRTR